MLTPAEFDTLVDGIYGAAIEPERWSAQLRLIAEAIGASGVALFAVDARSCRILFMHVSNMPIEQVRAYSQRYLQSAPHIETGPDTPSPEPGVDLAQAFDGETERSAIRIDDFRAWHRSRRTLEPGPLRARRNSAAAQPEPGAGFDRAGRVAPQDVAACPAGRGYQPPVDGDPGPAGRGKRRHRPPALRRRHARFPRSRAVLQSGGGDDVCRRGRRNPNRKRHRGSVQARPARAAQ